MRFSIAMATYNGARFIEEQLASFAAQTLKPAELVVCDDGSTDRTLEIVEGFARAAPFPVRVERNERQLGISDNFLKAASLCSERWIAFSDQDDVWDDGKLATLADVLRRTPDALLVAHRASLVDEHLVPLGLPLHVPSVSRTRVIPRLGRSFWSYPYGFTIAFHSRLVRDFPAQERPVWSHDRWIYILATSLGPTIFLPHLLALYRRHGNNASVLYEPPPISPDAIRGAASDGYAEELRLVQAVAEYFASKALVVGPDRDSLAEAASCFGSLSTNLRLRAALVDAGTRRLDVLRAVWPLVWRCGYRPHRRGGLGWRAGLKDLARLVIG